MNSGRVISRNWLSLILGHHPQTSSAYFLTAFQSHSSNPTVISKSRTSFKEPKDSPDVHLSISPAHFTPSLILNGSLLLLTLLGTNVLNNPVLIMPRKTPHSKNRDRTKPCALRQQAERPKHHGAALRPIPRQNDSRLAIKAELIRKYGLPSDCRIFFRQQRKYSSDEPPLTLITVGVW